MNDIQIKFLHKANINADKYRQLRDFYSNIEISKITIGDVISGLKGIPCLITDTSKVDPEHGIHYRNFSIRQLQKTLPCINNDIDPLPEALFYLLLTGDIPKKDDVENIYKSWSNRNNVPHYVFDIIDSFPTDSLPMAIFSTAIISMSKDSIFQQAHERGINKKDYWETYYEDIMNLIARLPRIAAYIYRRLYHNNQQIESNTKLDWSANFAHMMGFNSVDMTRLLRLHAIVHADHEGGNITAHTAHLIGSGLSNIYYSFGGSMLGLAGPLHGYASQNVMHWIFGLINETGSQEPSEQEIINYCKKTLSLGQKIPGYGHAVLKKTDPRFIAQKEFADKYIKNDNLVNLVNKIYTVVPEFLKSTNKVRNPWPNVDAFSGVLFNHYGIKEHNFYTVLFGVSRSLGVLVSLLNDRVYNVPIERPNSYPLEWYLNLAKGKKNL